MSHVEFTPSLRDDGSLDPECLENAGQRWIKNWLKARLSGSDPYFPIDRRSDEDPDALIVGILRENGLGHPASALVCRAVSRLLAEAGGKAPKLPSYFRGCIRLCQRVHLPQTNAWFTEQIAEFAKAHARTEQRWGGYEQAKEILFAGIVQAPGLPEAASSRSWERLLSTPRYATLALLSLSQSFSQQVSYLVRWWQSCPPAERQAELHQMMFTALKGEDEENLASIFDSAASSYPADLKAAINRALTANGASAVFTDGVRQLSLVNSIGGAISKAGHRRELLPELQVAAH